MGTEMQKIGSGVPVRSAPGIPQMIYEQTVEFYEDPQNGPQDGDEEPLQPGIYRQVVENVDNGEAGGQVLVSTPLNKCEGGGVTKKASGTSRTSKNSERLKSGRSPSPSHVSNKSGTGSSKERKPTTTAVEDEIISTSRRKKSFIL